MILPPGKDVQRHTSRKKTTFAVRVRLAVHDERYEDAAEQVEDFAELLETTTDTNLKLGLGDIVITNQIWDEGGSFPVGERSYAGQDCIFTILRNAGVNFGTG